jgi:two-component system aerobic respiration control protein ArcA
VNFKGHVVVVEDDNLLRKAIVNCYQKNNYFTTDFDCANGVVEFIEQCLHNQESTNPTPPVDIIVTDIVMPHESGYELIDSLKNKPNLGKIFISINSTLKDKIKGLRLGADDYIVKPIDSTELLLRTEALLSRIKPLSHDGPYGNGSTDIKFLHFKVNPESRLLQCKNQVLELGYTEHQLLLLMIGLQGKLINKQQIANTIYQSSEGENSRTIDKLVSRLRQKLSKVGGDAEYIITQRGKGYLLVSQV